MAGLQGFQHDADSSLQRNDAAGWLSVFSALSSGGGGLCAEARQAGVDTAHEHHGIGLELCRRHPVTHEPYGRRDAPPRLCQPCEAGRGRPWLSQIGTFPRSEPIAQRELVWASVCGKTCATFMADFGSPPDWRGFLISAERPQTGQGTVCPLTASSLGIGGNWLR